MTAARWATALLVSVATSTATANTATANTAAANPAAANAATPEPAPPNPRADPVFDRHFALMTARAARPLSFILAVHHRTDSPIRDDPFDNWLGFDGDGLKYGLGLRFGIVDGLDVGLLRFNGTVEHFDTYELDLRYQFLEQALHQVDLALRLGASWFAHEDGSHALKPFGQILATRVFYDHLLVSVGLLIHGDSSNATKAATDADWTVGGSVAVDARLTSYLAWGLEVAFGIAGYMEQIPVFATGPKLITGHHTFALVVTNTQYIGADGILTNSARPLENVILGFSLTSELRPFEED